MASRGQGSASPLTNMNFLVTVAEIEVQAAFAEAAGVEASVDVADFRQGNSAKLSAIIIPGLAKRKYGSMTLNAGYLLDQQFKTCVTKYLGPDLNSLQGEVAIDFLELIYEKLIVPGQ